MGLKICKEPDVMYKYFFNRELGNELALKNKNDCS